jgi:hypothetical protein
MQPNIIVAFYTDWLDTRYELFRDSRINVLGK